MKLTIFNGSPKTGKSNTEIMLDKFIEGFKEEKGNVCNVYKLNKFKNIKEAVKLVISSEYFLLAFPLYNYSMPSGVKDFIENLEPLIKMKKNIKIGFFIQYGFPEAIHARSLEKYLVRLCKRMKFEYLGTIIKGGCNNLTNGMLPEFVIKKIFTGIYNIGKEFGKEKILDKKLIDKFSKPEKSSLLMKFMMKLMIKSINKYSFQSELDKNGVSIEDSFARPYQK